MVNDLIMIDFAGVLGIVFMVVYLRQNGHMERGTKNEFYSLVLLELTEMFVYSAELVTASFPQPTVWRIIFSIIGYVIRPLLLYIILLLSLRADHNLLQKKVLLIPALTNFLVVSTALFSDVCFGYDVSNVFYRGILGYCPHFTLTLYLAILLFYTIRDSLKERTFEHAIIYLMATVIIVSVIIEAVFSVRSMGRTAIVMCTVFYYMYFQTQEYNEELKKNHLEINGLNTKVHHDPMTKLLNKEAFCNNCLESFARNPVDTIAFIFIDLDYFKQVNDNLGHLTGDEAIICTANQLKRAFRDDVLICRFGGDEFCVCMRKISCDDLAVKLEYLCKIIKQEYWNADHTKSVMVSCSIGAVYCENCSNISYENLIVEADRVVYKVKNNGRGRALIEKI